MDKALISALWGNGKVKAGEHLTPRREVLKKVGPLKDKGSKLTNLYNSLVGGGFVEFNICYIAKTDMPIFRWKDRGYEWKWTNNGNVK